VLKAQAAIWALWKSGVKFREIELADGTVARWRRPRLEPWEEPRQDPSEPCPMHPRVLAQRREARRRQRERQQVRDAAQRAAPARYEGAQTSDGPAPVAAREKAG
jgi:hypothetical protein